MGEDKYHGLDCICEICIQDYPERECLEFCEGEWDDGEPFLYVAGAIERWRQLKLKL